MLSRAMVSAAAGDEESRSIELRCDVRHAAPSEGGGRPRSKLRSSLQTKRGGRERGSKRDDSVGDEDVGVALRPSPPLSSPPLSLLPRWRSRRQTSDAPPLPPPSSPQTVSLFRVCVYCADVEARATPTGSYDSFSLFTSSALIIIVTVLLSLFFRCLVLGCALIFLQKFPPQFQLPQKGTENYSSGSNYCWLGSPRVT